MRRGRSWSYIALLLCASANAEFIRNGDFEMEKPDAYWRRSELSEIREQGGNHWIRVRSLYDGVFALGSTLRQPISTDVTNAVLSFDLSLQGANAYFFVIFAESMVFELNEPTSELSYFGRVTVDVSQLMDGSERELMFASSCLLRDGSYLNADIDNVSLAPVPEPASVVTAIAGAAGFALRRRRLRE